MTSLVHSHDAGPAPGWSDDRWRKILDRIEHRQPGVGLRFWGPPLWLEVTMEGPDSDRWPVVGNEAVSWDWQSNTACDEADELAGAGADDDQLLAVVARYTIENLILNAVHEIGEWLRLDGQRLFPAHTARGALPLPRGDQGNGSVTCTIGFDDDDGGGVARPPSSSPPGPQLGRDTSRVPAAVVLPSRFTYLPGTTVSFGVDGPIIAGSRSCEPIAPWRSAWSPATLDAVRAGSPTAVALIARDVHRALVSYEADRICRSFHVDGAAPWTFADDRRLGAGPWLSVAIDHAAS